LTCPRRPDRNLRLARALAAQLRRGERPLRSERLVYFCCSTSDAVALVRAPASDVAAAFSLVQLSGSKGCFFSPGPNFT